MGVKSEEGSICGVVTGPFVERTIGVDFENGTRDAAVSCGVWQLFSMVESGGSDDGTAELWEKLFSFSNSTFDYTSEEDDVFEASRFEREKPEEERIAKRKLQ